VADFKLKEQDLAKQIEEQKAKNNVSWQNEIARQQLRVLALCWFFFLITSDYVSWI
jgi:hypothetical protein